MRRPAVSARAAAAAAGTAALVTTVALAAATPSAASTGGSSGRSQATPSGPRFPEELSITGAASHRRPVPREQQEVRWTLRNLGTRTIDRAALETRVPAGWTLGRADGCERSGHRLRCERGPLASGQRSVVRLRMTVPERPRLGGLWLWASTRFQVAGHERPGPDAALRLHVVRHR